MTEQAINMENLLKGNPASKIQESLGYTKESVIRNWLRRMRLNGLTSR